MKPLLGLQLLAAVLLAMMCALPEVGAVTMSASGRTGGRIIAVQAQRRALLQRMRVAAQAKVAAELDADADADASEGEFNAESEIEIESEGEGEGEGEGETHVHDRAENFGEALALALDRAGAGAASSVARVTMSRTKGKVLVLTCKGVKYRIPIEVLHDYLAWIAHFYVRRSVTPNPTAMLEEAKVVSTAVVAGKRVVTPKTLAQWTAVAVLPPTAFDFVRIGWFLFTQDPHSSYVNLAITESTALLEASDLPNKQELINSIAKYDSESYDAMYDRAQASDGFSPDEIIKLINQNGPTSRAATNVAACQATGALLIAESRRNRVTPFINKLMLEKLVIKHLYGGKLGKHPMGAGGTVSETARPFHSESKGADGTLVFQRELGAVWDWLNNNKVCDVSAKPIEHLHTLSLSADPAATSDAALVWLDRSTIARSDIGKALLAAAGIDVPAHRVTWNGIGFGLETEEKELEFKADIVEAEVKNREADHRVVYALPVKHDGNCVLASASVAHLLPLLNTAAGTPATPAGFSNPAKALFGAPALTDRQVAELHNLLVVYVNTAVAGRAAVLSESALWRRLVHQLRTRLARAIETERHSRLPSPASLALSPSEIRRIARETEWLGHAEIDVLTRVMGVAIRIVKGYAHGYSATYGGALGNTIHLISVPGHYDPALTAAIPAAQNVAVPLAPAVAPAPVAVDEKKEKPAGDHWWSETKSGDEVMEQLLWRLMKLGKASDAVCRAKSKEDGLCFGFIPKIALSAIEHEAMRGTFPDRAFEQFVDLFQDPFRRLYSTDTNGRSRHANEQSLLPEHNRDYIVRRVLATHFAALWQALNTFKKDEPEAWTLVIDGWRATQFHGPDRAAWLTKNADKPKLIAAVKAVRLPLWHIDHLILGLQRELVKAATSSSETKVDSAASAAAAKKAPVVKTKAERDDAKASAGGNDGGEQLMRKSVFPSKGMGKWFGAMFPDAHAVLEQVFLSPDNRFSGYLEVTLGGDKSPFKDDGRIVYNYVLHRVWVTATHYFGWTLPVRTATAEAKVDIDAIVAADAKTLEAAETGTKYPKLTIHRDKNAVKSVPKTVLHSPWFEVIDDLVLLMQRVGERLKADSKFDY